MVKATAMMALRFAPLMQYTATPVHEYTVHEYIVHAYMGTHEYTNNYATTTTRPEASHN